MLSKHRKRVSSIIYKLHNTHKHISVVFNSNQLNYAYICLQTHSYIHTYIPSTQEQSNSWRNCLCLSLCRWHHQRFEEEGTRLLSLSIYIYIYIYVYMCVCVDNCNFGSIDSCWPCAETAFVMRPQLMWLCQTVS